MGHPDSRRRSPSQPETGRASSLQLSTTMAIDEPSKRPTSNHSALAHLPHEARHPKTDLEAHIDRQRQNHLRTIALLDKAAQGETIDQTLISPELLEDPLDAHLLYVRWTLDTYASHQSQLKQNLISVLEQSTRRFVTDDRYRTDSRYLKLWVLYARQCSKQASIEIYQYLYSKQIGIDYSMLYEEWASSIEQHNQDASEVERVFELGIQHGAQPIGRLKKKKATALKRISESSSILSEKKFSDSKSGLDSSPQLLSQQKTKALDQNASHNTSPHNAEKSCDNPLSNHYVPASTARASDGHAPAARSTSHKASGPTTQRLAINLTRLYPEDRVELSPEECKATREYGSKVWGLEPWEEEALTTMNWYFYNSDGSPVLYHPMSGEPMFEYLKVGSSPSSEMQLSDDGQEFQDVHGSKSDSSFNLSRDEGHSIQDVQGALPACPADLSSSTDDYYDGTEAGHEGAADTEISIKLDSPDRNSSAPFIRARNRRASVTLHTQAAMNDVYSMYAKDNNGDDESDDNFDASDVGDDDRLYGEPTGYTVAGIRDATEDVTFWSQPAKQSNPSGERDSRQQFPSIVQDENAIGLRQPLKDPSRTFGASSSITSVPGSSRGPGAFKPVRKPLAPVVPFCDENAIISTSSSGAKPFHQEVGASGSKRIPLAVKASHSYQPASEHEDDREHPEDYQDPVSVNRKFVWQPDDPPEPLSDEFHTPDMEKESFDVFESAAREEEDEESEGGMDYDYENDNDMDRPNRLISRPLRFVPTGDNFNAMTPITERTSECNSMTASRYINRAQEACFQAYQQSACKYSEVGSEEEDSEMTPRANNLVEDDPGLSYPVRREGGPADQAGASQISTQAYLETLSLDNKRAASPTSPSRRQQLHHNPDTPSKILAHIGKSHSKRTRSSMSDSCPNSPNKHLADDSMLASPSRGELSQYPPPTPTTIQASEPCNPFAEDIVNILLDGLDPPLEDYPGFRSLADLRANKLEQLQKRCKARTRKHSHGGIQADEPLWELELDGDVYFIHDKLGEGAYGSVFKVSEATDEDTSLVCESSPVQKAMKVESPPNLYEFSILSQLHEKLSERVCESIIGPQRLYAYADESFLVMDYADQGTLLDIVNRAGDIGIKPTAPGVVRGVDELLAMFFTVELMRVVEGLHEVGYIHGDLKIDNCLIRLQSPPGGSKTWGSAYDPTGGQGWRYKGLKLIDYGRSIDTNVFPPNQEFIADWETDEYDCWEMREGEPWTFQPDYHGIVAIAHCLLFGAFMTEKDSLKPGFRRYHQCELWMALFEACLRPKKVPNTEELRVVRGKMEDWLQENCERNAKSLKGFLKKIEVACMAHR